MTFKVGDRVTYVGWMMDELVGKSGTVREVLSLDNILVDWDGCDWSSGVLPESLEKLTEKTSAKDTVNHPDHYNNGGIECIEYLKDNMSWQGYTGYLEGNCKKYLHRWRYKQKPIEDLKKARWYLDRLIGELETEGTDP